MGIAPRVRRRAIWPASIRWPIVTSSSALSSGTLPISLRYSLTGSSLGAADGASVDDLQPRKVPLLDRILWTGRKARQSAHFGTTGFLSECHCHPRLLSNLRGREVSAQELDSPS